MCSAVFITGLDPEFAAENVGYFTAPYAERAKLGKPIIDRAGGAVHVTLPNGVRRTARSEEHTSEPSHQIISYAVFCLKKKISNPTVRSASTRYRRSSTMIRGRC